MSSLFFPPPGDRVEGEIFCERDRRSSWEVDSEFESSSAVLRGEIVVRGQVRQDRRGHDSTAVMHYIHAKGQNEP